jgi:hypothetical protein
MRNKSDDEKNMPDVFVSNAREWAGELVRREARGPGDYENAMRRLESRYGIQWQTFWRLRHGRIKDISASIYARINAAYCAECERQQRLLAGQIEIAKAKGLTSAPAVRKAEALLDHTEE